MTAPTISASASSRLRRGREADLTGAVGRMLVSTERGAGTVADRQASKAYATPDASATATERAIDFSRTEKLLDTLAHSDVRCYWAAFDAVLEASAPGWDGYDGRPVTVAALRRGLKFLRTLPPEIPDPEINPSVSGVLAFDWQTSQERVFSVSVNHADKLIYAGLYSGAFQHGQEDKWDMLPESVIAGIRRVYEQTGTR